MWLRVLGLVLLTATGGSVAAEDTLPLRQWVDMEATAVMGPQASRTDTVEPDYRAYSSMEATDDGRIIYWGGGHGNYGGNDMDVYHVAENEWQQETEEENWKVDLDSWEHLGNYGQPPAEEVKRAYGSGPTANYLTGRGRPGTRHVYQQAAWWPEKGWFVFDYKFHLWAWDPDQGDSNGAFFKVYDGHTSQGYPDPSYWNLAHDPDSGTLISFNSADDSVYRLRDGVWRKVMDVPFSGNKGEVFSEYHTADRVHYVQRWSDLYTVDLGTRTVKDIPDSPPQAGGNNGMWIEYSPERKQMLVMGFGPAGLGVWGYNTRTASWDRIEINGTVLRGDGQPITDDDLRWDMLERDPVSGNFFFLALDKGNPSVAPPTYAFRLSDEAGRARETDPSSHPTNQWVDLPIPNTPGGLPNGNGKDIQIEYREKTGNLVLCCGDWLQNDGVKGNGNQHVYEFDPDSNGWWILVEPCTGETQPDGWDEVPVAIRHDELWGFPSFGWKTECPSDTRAETMALDLSSRQWRVTGHGFLYPNKDIGFAGYDPVTDRFYVAQRPGVDEIDPENPEAGILTRHSDGNDYRVSRNQMFLDVKGRAVYLTERRRKELIRFDLDGHGFRRVARIPDGAVASNAWAVWDPNHRVILAPPGSTEGNKRASNTVYAYHVDLGLWQKMEYPNDGTVPFGNSVGYDEDSELLVQMGTKSYPQFQSVFVLEYSPQATGVIEPWVRPDSRGAGVRGQTLDLPLRPSSDGASTPGPSSPSRSQEELPSSPPNSPTTGSTSTSKDDVGLPESGGTLQLSAPKLSLSISQRTLAAGETVVLSWQANRADRCTASGAWSGGRQLTGRTSITPSETGALVYTLTCSNEVGERERSVELTVR